MKKFAVFLFLILCTTLVFAAVMKVDHLSGWTAWNGKWDNILTNTNEVGTIIATGEGKFNNVIFETKARLIEGRPSGSDHIMLHISADSSNNSLPFRNTYMFVVRQNEINDAYIMKYFRGNSIDNFAHVPFTYNMFDWHTYKFVKNGTSLKGFVDDALLVNVNDTSLGAGFVGLAAAGKVEFKDFSAIRIG